LSQGADTHDPYTIGALDLACFVRYHVNHSVENIRNMVSVLASVAVISTVLSSPVTCIPKTRIDVLVGKLTTEYDVYRRICEIKQSARVILHREEVEFDVTVVRSDDMDASVHMSMSFSAAVGGAVY